MSLGSERDDVWGEEKSQEQGTSDTIDAPSASRFFPPEIPGEASSFAIGSHPPAAKKTKRASKWQEDWNKHNMKQSKRGSSLVHCNLCGNDFSIASGGVHEVKRHVATKRHTEQAQSSLERSRAEAMNEDIVRTVPV